MFAIFLFFFCKIILSDITFKFFFFTRDIKNRLWSIITCLIKRKKERICCCCCLQKSDRLQNKQPFCNNKIIFKKIYKKNLTKNMVKKTNITRGIARVDSVHVVLALPVKIIFFFLFLRVWIKPEKNLMMYGPKLNSRIYIETNNTVVTKQTNKQTICNNNNNNKTVEFYK